MKLASPRECVFDIECDGFNPTKIHCISVHSAKGKLKSTTNYDNMRKFFTNPNNILIGHNIVRFDVVVVEKLLGITVKAKLVDTLALSWYLFPNRIQHGLESWGEEFGVPKPVVTDWDGLTPEEYIHRCEGDVKINAKLWKKCWSYLKRLYVDEDKAWRLIDYLTFKMVCAKDQEQLRWKLDVNKAMSGYQELSRLKQEKVGQLANVMPKLPVMKTATVPAKPFKKNGERSASGIRWDELCAEHNHNPDIPIAFDYVASYRDSNPGYMPNVKSWLVELGWIPETFKYSRDKETGETKMLEQVNLPHGAGICPSIKKLYHLDPNLELLDGLSVLIHRIGMLKGFLNNMSSDGYVKARIKGFTNTLRVKHTELANLPGVDKPYGAMMRGCLVAPDGYEMVGSDMSALEDRTKQHYMWKHDPEYVKAMMEEGYCPHVDIAVMAKFLSPEQEERHKVGGFIDKADEKVILAGRKKAKPVNYGGAYGQKAKGLAQQTGMPLHEAAELTRIYEQRNWSLEAIAEECVVKTVNGQRWLFQPVSQLWYTLRGDKDRFSTLNQGTGVWCFDLWVKHLKSMGMPVCGAFHDEACAAVRIGKRKGIVRMIKEAMRRTNEELKLNRELDCSVDFGAAYSDVH